MIEVSKESITNLLKNHPRLTVEGYDAVGVLIGQENTDDLISKQKELLEETRLFNIHKVVCWIEENLYKADHISQFSSYTWKHICEKNIGSYVTNGEFIAAALFLGCNFEGKGNLYFNLEVSPYALIKN
jgi:hypothetical protein